MSVTLASPYLALAALAGLAPLTATGIRMLAARRVRRSLGLAAPSIAAQLARPVALGSAFALLGLAAAQPSVRLQHERTARSDAAMLLVLDGSRSMLASSGPEGTPRWERAVSFARRLHHALPEVPVGISSLTNRILPYVFPTVDDAVYDAVLDQAYGIERPPPKLDLDPWVTTFEPLNEVAARHFFAAGVRKRVVVVLSDIETHDFDAAAVLRNLRQSGATPVVVRFWREDERIYQGQKVVGRYRAARPEALASLQWDGWPGFRESQFDTVVDSIRTAIGSGPTARAGYEQRDRSIAPIVASAALAPLLLVVAPAGLLPPVRLRRRAPSRDPQLH
jgi:hypothetical protein